MEGCKTVGAWMADAEACWAAASSAKVVEGLVREVPDFPKPGILFRDMMPVLASARGLRAVVAGLSWQLGALEEGVGGACTHVVGVEARGFLLGVPVAERGGRGFVAARKPGKLPGAVRRRSYGLEYGSGELELQEGLLGPGDAVVVVDDLLATGGTAECAAELCREAGATVLGYLFLAELSGLGGRGRLSGQGCAVRSLLVYP